MNVTKYIIVNIYIMEMDYCVFYGQDNDTEHTSVLF